MLSKVTFTPAVGSAIDLHASTGSYKVSRAEGIVGPPDPREVTRTAPGRDGTLDDTRFLTERKITLEGEIIGSSQSDVWTKWDALAAAFQSTLLSKGTLTVTLPDGTTQRQCSVILTGSAQPAFEGGSAYLQYQVNFRAPDPRWYGTTLNTSNAVATGTNGSGTGSAVNNGNAPTSPSFTFGGTFQINTLSVTVPTAYTTISPQGSTISMTLLGSSGSSLGYSNVTSSSSINCQSRTASGVTGDGIQALTEWPILYPGTSSWSQTSGVFPAASRTVTMSWRDAWW